jgi:charged multivesicular body protein 3
MKMAGSIQASTEVMKEMSNLMRLPELQKTMTEMSREMMKAGIIDEMVQDSLDSVLDEEGIDEIADNEVDKIILEITQGKLKDLPSMNQPGMSLPQTVLPSTSDRDEEADDMSQRLEALKS